jgi:hypothetical protein
MKRIETTITQSCGSQPRLMCTLASEFQVRGVLMLTEKSNDTQTKALIGGDQTLQEQNQALQIERLVLIKHYQTLYKKYQVLIGSCPTRQKQYQDIAVYRQSLQNYRQSQQEHRQLIQQFRRTLHKNLIITRSYRKNLTSQIQAGRPLIRKTILLG